MYLDRAGQIDVVVTMVKVYASFSLSLFSGKMDMISQKMSQIQKDTIKIYKSKMLISMHTISNVFLHIMWYTLCHIVLTFFLILPHIITSSKYYDIKSQTTAD